MKACVLTASVLLVLSACTSSMNNSRSGDTTAVSTQDSINTITSGKLCFQRLEGTANQDTAHLELSITGSDVSGILNHIPYGKDSRKGTINGHIKGDIIKGVWSFMQEGINDTLDVEFKLEGNRLLQKNYSVNQQTGRQYLSDTSRFAMEYAQVDCTN